MILLTVDSNDILRPRPICNLVASILLMTSTLVNDAVGEQPKKLNCSVDLDRIPFLVKDTIHPYYLRKNPNLGRQTFSKVASQIRKLEAQAEICSELYLAEGKAKSSADEPTVAEQSANLFRACIRRDIEILWTEPERQITHAAAHEVGLVTAILQAIQHLQSVLGDVGPGHGVLGPRDNHRRAFVRFPYLGQATLPGGEKQAPYHSSTVPAEFGELLPLTVVTD